MEKFVHEKLVPDIINLINKQLKDLPEYLSLELNINKEDVAICLDRFFDDLSKKPAPKTTSTTSSSAKKTTSSPQDKDDKLSLYKERLNKTKIKEGYLNLESGRAVKKNDGNLKKFEFDEQLNAAIPKSADALKTFALLKNEKPEPSKPEPSKPEPSKPEPSKPEPSKSEPSLAEKKDSEHKKSTAVKKKEEKDEGKDEKDEEETATKVSGLASKKTQQKVVKPATKTSSTSDSKLPVVKLNDQGFLVDPKMNFVWDSEPAKNGKILGVWNDDTNDYDELDDDDIKVITKNKWEYEIPETTCETDEEAEDTDTSTKKSYPKDDVQQVKNKISSMLTTKGNNKKVQQTIDTDTDDDSSFSDEDD